MEDFKIIDIHIHLCRTPEEESNYFPIPGRRVQDRWATPERVIAYMGSEGHLEDGLYDSNTTPASGTPLRESETMGAA